MPQPEIEQLTLPNIQKSCTPNSSGPQKYPSTDSIHEPTQIQEVCNEISISKGGFGCYDNFHPHVNSVWVELAMRLQLCRLLVKWRQNGRGYKILLQKWPLW